MNITARNSTKVDDVLTMSVAHYQGVYLFIDYTPGDEVQVYLEFAVKLDTNPIDKFFKLMANSRKLRIALVPGACVYPIPVPQLAQKLEVSFLALGDSTSALVDVYVDKDSEG
jgi:hypothetical protein